MKDLRDLKDLTIHDVQPISACSDVGISLPDNVAHGAGSRTEVAGLRVDGGWWRVSGLGFRVSGSGFRVPGCGLPSKCSYLRLIDFCITQL